MSLRSKMSLRYVHPLLGKHHSVLKAYLSTGKQMQDYEFRSPAYSGSVVSCLVLSLHVDIDVECSGASSRIVGVDQQDQLTGIPLVSLARETEAGVRHRLTTY